MTASNDAKGQQQNGKRSRRDNQAVGHCPTQDGAVESLDHPIHRRFNGASHTLRHRPESAR